MKIFKRIINQLRLKVNRYNYFKKNSKLVSKKLSIISNDCCGGVLYHQMGRKFLSPTINLYFDNEDFTNFCTNLKTYLESDLFLNKEGTMLQKHIIGRISPNGLPDVDLHFLHYKTFEEARDSWEKRKQRINFRNILFIFNLTNNLDAGSCKKIISDFKSKQNSNNGRSIFLVRHDLNLEDVYKINFYNTEFIHAQIVQSPDKSYKRFIDQLFQKNIL